MGVHRKGYAFYREIHESVDLLRESEGYIKRQKLDCERNKF